MNKLKRYLKINGLKVIGWTSILFSLIYIIKGFIYMNAGDFFAGSGLAFNAMLVFLTDLKFPKKALRETIDNER